MRALDDVAERVHRREPPTVISAPAAGTCSPNAIAVLARVVYGTSWTRAPRVRYGVQLGSWSYYLKTG
jgi:hypothetical protein